MPTLMTSSRDGAHLSRTRFDSSPLKRLPIDFTWSEGLRVCDFLLYEQRTVFSLNDYALVSRMLREYLYLADSVEELNGASACLAQLSEIVKIMLFEDGSADLPYLVPLVFSPSLTFPLTLILPFPFPFPFPYPFPYP